MEVTTLTILLSELTGAASDSLILGASYPLSLGFGDLFNTEGNRFARNTIIVTDDNDLDPILQAQKTYVPSGGQNTFTQSMGTVAAKQDGEAVIFVNNTTDSYKSVNNGELFVQNPALPASCTANGRDSAAYSPTTSTLLVRVAGFSTARVMRSTDGVNFSIVSIGIGVTVTSVFCSAGGTWYCSTDTGVFTSTDDGLTWNASPQAIPNIVSFTEAFGNRVIAARSDQIWYTDNSGASWTQATIPSTSPMEAVDFIGNNTLIVVSSQTGNNRISTDNGVNWTAYNLLNSFGDNSGISRSIWSDNSGRAIFGVRDANYDGTKDRTVIVETKDFGATLSQTGSVNMGSGSLGFAQGASMRLFLSSNTYDASDFPITYTYLDQGYQGGVGDSTTDNWVTLIKKNV